MSEIIAIFERIYKLTHDEGQCDFTAVLLQSISKRKEDDQNELQSEKTSNNFENQQLLLQKIIKEIDNLVAIINNDDSILISVRNQKLLRTCFQIVTYLGFSTCLIPGLGISLLKRCSSAIMLPPSSLTDEQKYETLVTCTDFFTRCYKIPVLKNIILTFHLSDYLAALIQLSFAPLKKPGVYKKFIMTEEMYKQLQSDQQKYIEVYEHLVGNCFQPILMKELLVLQSVTDPLPPAFVKRVIAKEMSRRLLASGGLLSLIRCFIESYNIDTGYEWKKIDMICKIVAAKHGNGSIDDYLNNICSQLMQILTLNNTHYLATAVACILLLHERYPESDSVKVLVKEIFGAFDYDSLVLNHLPGSVILSPQEIDHKVNVLHASVCTSRINRDISLILPNLYIIFLLGVKCTKNEDLKIKLKEIAVQCLSELKETDISEIVKMCLFGHQHFNSLTIVVEEFDTGLYLKCLRDTSDYPKSDAMLHFLDIFKSSTDNFFIHNVFQACLKILIDLSKKRYQNNKKSDTVDLENEIDIINESDEQYGYILQFLSAISTSPKILKALKTNPMIVLHFIDHFLLNSQTHYNEESITIALVLLNTILPYCNQKKDLNEKLIRLIPILKQIAENDTNFNNILCKEALLLISSKKPLQTETKCGKAISDTFDSLLPVRAHGIIELTKLIEAKDPETISKKHYIFCLFQEHLKDPDSYIYLSSINGIAALSTHCTEDVLEVLCKEFLQVSSEQKNIETKSTENKIAELRMKIGDILVKVTKRLGEMAIVHKTILLNTILCGCRDNDPIIRTSALSNLAEIALVLHYKMGSIIYEVLLCIWSIIESDKAVECRRAAVMVFTSLLKGLGKDTLVQLKENILPIYRTLKNIYNDPNEDSVVRLHAQLALEELNETVKRFVLPELKFEKQIFVMDTPEKL